MVNETSETLTFHAYRLWNINELVHNLYMTWDIAKL